MIVNGNSSLTLEQLENKKLWLEDQIERLKSSLNKVEDEIAERKCEIEKQSEPIITNQMTMF